MHYTASWGPLDLAVDLLGWGSFPGGLAKQASQAPADPWEGAASKCPSKSRNSTLPLTLTPQCSRPPTASGLRTSPCTCQTPGDRETPGPRIHLPDSLCVWGGVNPFSCRWKLPCVPTIAHNHCLKEICYSLVACHIIVL